MSSLIFATSEDSALIATDTLAVSETKTPFSFTSKAIIVSHLRMVIAGTGIMGFSTRWFSMVNDNMVVKDIDHLDLYTPEALHALWPGYLKEFSIPPDIATTTIYHFGFSKYEILSSKLDPTGKIIVNRVLPH